ncbi:MAG: GTP diphosphokinase [Candidatus Promineifilaceae bacterium]
MKKPSPPSIDEFLNLLTKERSTVDTEKIKEVHEFLTAVHKDHRHPSGDTHVNHDMAVANIMHQLGADTTSIIASLLHDILEPHTQVTLDDIRQRFGTEIADLVEDVNNLRAFVRNTSLEDSKKEKITPKRLEEIRQALLSLIEGDIRVILIRLADALQDLRMANRMPVTKKMRIASEAQHIYAPLANRLGIWQLKWELEDLAFRYLQPDKYKEIAANLAERRDQRLKRINAAIDKLQKRLDEKGIKATVTGRPKHIYSIYRKMQRKGLDFEHIYDVQAIRVILDPNETPEYQHMSQRERDAYDRDICYQVLGEVYALWRPIPEEFDDYIAMPKPNGYKSLHTAVLDIETGQTLEVQIRSWRMHEEAEKGIAAHWAYKEDGAPHVSSFVQRKLQGLRDLLQSMQAGEGLENGSLDILDSELFADRIYTFTPKGDVVELPAGSTPIDFAYQIHTNVGHRCRHAKVNGKLVSLDYKLKSGDRVEIITANRGGPSRDWMNASLGYTGSARTRSKIRQWFRQQEREQNIEQGRETIERELKRLGLQDTFDIADIAQALRFEEIDEFLAKVGFGDIQSTQISGAIALLRGRLKPDDELQPLLEPKEETTKSKALTVAGVQGLHTKMAGCCNPIAPEPIIGYITRGRGITIHSKDCPQVKALNEPERLVTVHWGVDRQTHPIHLKIQGYGGQVLVDQVFHILRHQQISVSRSKTIIEQGVTHYYLVVEVPDLAQLNWLINKLEGLPNVLEVRRQRWK